MVVISIMAILSTALILNLAGQRATRDIKIAENELVSNIRKTQSYSLSDKILPNGQIAQYYLLKFDLANPSQYKIQALYNVSSSPSLVDVETINLPPNIQFAPMPPSTYAINVNPRPLNPTNQPIYTGCALIAFAEPFGKVIFNDGCSPVNPTMPYSLVLSDDYYSKIINFQNNVACDGNNGSPPGPPVCSASTDSSMVITLSDAKKTIFRTVTINAITGAVSFN